MTNKAVLIPRQRMSRARRSGPLGGAAGLLAGLAGGALLAFLFDPDRGRSRRAMAADRLAATGRRSARQLRRFGRRTGASFHGFRARTLNGSHGQVHPDDATLAHRIESELFRDPAIPKGHMNINVENGIVVLRGAVDDAGLSAVIERRVQRIPGVAGIRNLLHETGAPAPNWPTGSVATG